MRHDALAPLFPTGLFLYDAGFAAAPRVLAGVVPAIQTFGLTSTMNARKQLEEQLSVAEVASRIGVDESTVWRWIRQGKIKPVRKLGRRITRVPASAVNRFLVEHSINE